MARRSARDAAADDSTTIPDVVPEGASAPRRRRPPANVRTPAEENPPAVAQTAARARRAPASGEARSTSAPARPRTRGPRVVPVDATPAVDAVEAGEDSRATIPATDRTRLLARAVAGIVALILIVAVALTTAFWLSTRGKLSDSDQLSRARDSALASARTYAVDLFTYDYRTLDADFARVLNEATGDFKTKFSGASGQLGPAIKQAQAKSTATVTAAGIASATLDTVVVDLFVDQTVTNTSTPTPRLDRSRIEMTLKANGAGWLVAQIDVK